MTECTRATRPAPQSLLAAAVLVLFAAGCSTGPGGGDDWDYDRQRADPFAYLGAAAAGGDAALPSGPPPAATAGTATAGPATAAPATASPGEITGRRGAGFDARVEAARRGARLAGRPAGAVAPGGASPEDARLRAAEQRRLRLQAETPSPRRSADDIARDRHQAVRDVAGARRAGELAGQRRAASDALMAGRPAQTGPGSRADEVNRRFHDEARAGFGAPTPARRRAPIGGVPDVGPLTLP